MFICWNLPLRIKSTWDLYPTQEIISESVACSVSIENSPWKFVVAPTEEPLKIIFAKGTGSLLEESVTTPRILVYWAKEIMAEKFSKNTKKMIRYRDFIFILPEFDPLL